MRVPSQASYPIFEIQGRGELSPYSGQTVTTTGVVTAVQLDPKNPGFYLQDPTGDGDDSTSDAVFVASEDVLKGAGVKPGQKLNLTGRVSERYGVTTLENVSARSLKPIKGSAAAKVPAASALQLPDSKAKSTTYLEARESMLVGIQNALVMAPTDDFNEFVVVDETSHGTGKHYDEKAAGQRLIVDGGALGGKSPKAMVGTGDRIRNLTGPLGYSGFNEDYVLMPSARFGEIKRGQAPARRWGDIDGDDRITDSDIAMIKRRVDTPADGPLDPSDLNGDGRVTRTDVNQAVKRAKLATGAPSFRIHTFNVENMFDTINDPTDDPSVSPTAYELKLVKIASAIREQLNSPDVVALQEVEKGDILKDLASRPELRGLGYKHALIQGPDARGINVGLMFRGDTVKVNDVRTANKRAELDDGLSKGPAANLLFSRPPLIADLTIGKGDQKSDVTVIVNHFKSKFSPNKLPTEPRRIEQAKFVAKLVDDLRTAHPGREVIVTGDLNDGEGTKSLKALMGGTKRPRLVNALENVPKGERYSYNHNGKVDLIDHILVTPGLAKRVEDAGVRHFNTDIPASYGWNGGALKSSDHDSPYAAFRFGETLAKEPAAVAGAKVGAARTKTSAAK